MTTICQTNTALTDTDLQTIYGNGVQQGILPAEPYQQSDREANGMLKETTIQQIIATLKSKGVISINSDEKQKALLVNLQDEYCFYDSRYKYSLQKLLTSIQQVYIENSTQNQQIMYNYLDSTRKLNQRLNDLAQVSNGISNDMLKTATTLKSQISSFNKNIKEKQQKLEKQNKTLSSQEAIEKLNREQVKFTEEKARYTNNLLKTYSFLNIVALGLLVYIYRSAS
jgi:hypothetical protein